MVHFWRLVFPAVSVTGLLGRSLSMKSCITLVTSTSAPESSPQTLAISCLKAKAQWQGRETTTRSNAKTGKSHGTQNQFSSFVPKCVFFKNWPKISEPLFGPGIFFLQNGGEKKFHCFMTSFQEFKSHDDFCSKWHFAYSPTCLLAKCPSDWLAPKIDVKMNQIWNSCHLVRQLCKVSTRSYGLCHQSLKKLQKHWYIVIDWLNKDYCTKFYYMLSSLILEANAWV